MRLDQRKWRARRLLALIELLGGKCAQCGATQRLEFDHIDRATKLFDITGNITRAWDILLAEVNKCQLLCRPHHQAKTARENERAEGPRIHGLYSTYVKGKCRCDACRAANAAYSRRYAVGVLA